MTRKVVDRCYSPTAWEIGDIWNGWRIVERRKMSKLEQIRYNGKGWAFIGERAGSRLMRLGDRLVGDIEE